MKKLTLAQHMVASIVVGLIVGMMLKMALPYGEPESIMQSTPSSGSIETVASTISLLPTQVDMSIAFTTLEGVWFVKTVFIREGPPEILKVMSLETGRISLYPSGEYRIRILDEEKKSLYEMPFLVTFMKGEPLKSVDEIEMIFIIPRMVGEQYIQVESPYGVSLWEIP